MTFEPTIKVGDILTLLGFLIGGLGFIWAMRGEIRMLARDVRLQGKQIEKLETIIVKQAAQDERLNAIDRRVEDLRHGRGFVQRDIDGLWGIGGKASTG